MPTDITNSLTKIIKYKITTSSDISSFNKYIESDEFQTYITNFLLMEIMLNYKYTPTDTSNTYTSNSDLLKINFSNIINKIKLLIIEKIIIKKKLRDSSKYSINNNDQELDKLLEKMKKFTEAFDNEDDTFVDTIKTFNSDTEIKLQKGGKKSKKYTTKNEKKSNKYITKTKGRRTNKIKIARKSKK
jgi:hypothetical protein